MENKLHILNGYSDELFPINICVVRKYSDLPIGSGFKSLHWHEDLQFVLCTKGYVNYQVNGIEYKLKEKEALFINKGALHMSSDMSEDGEYVTLTFPEELLFFFKESRMKYKYVWPYTRMDFLRCYEIKEENEIISYLYDIYNIYLNGSDMFEYDVSILITMIWRHLVKCLSKIDFIPNKKDIADAGTMSIAQCNRCFNKMLNVTPYEYLIQYRLQKATNLLKDATLNVTEISEIVGFNNVTHFIQAFKKVYGISPKKYRMMEDQNEKGS